MQGRGRTRTGCAHVNVNRWGTRPATLRCMTAAGSEPIPTKSTQRHPFLAPARPVPVADLHLATVDPTGRVWLRQPARLLGWVPGRKLTVSIRDAVVHVSGSTDKEVGIAAALDDRERVKVPYGLRMMVGFHTGVRVLVVTIPAEGSVAILPVHRVVAAFGVGR